jgi:hypothetical protein
MTDPNDRKDQLCTECGVGRYQETSIHDDWDGVLHCTNKECNYEVRRYKSMDNFEPEPDRVVKLSPAAQAVLDAAINVAESPDAEAIAAAALRAVADQVVPETTTPWNSTLTLIMSTPEVRAKLLTIADELEAHQ